jgi:DNA-binding NarL/FixJ family response regulator
MRTLLIVDDHGGFRAWAREVLSQEGFRVVGEAGDGAAAIAAVDALRPEVVLLDVRLPDLDGFAVAERIGERATVVLTSGRPAADFGPAIARAAAAGFLDKGDLCGESLARILEGADP